jgi:hypothetical protein
MSSFPKTPNKRITGNLQITVRPPGVSLSVEEKEQIGLLKMPAGFSVQDTMKQTLDKRIKSCHDSIQEIQNKNKTCESCKGLSVQHESSVYDILGAVHKVGNMKEDKIGLVLGQNLEGDITLDLIYSDKLCAIIVYEDSFSVGMYSKDNLVREELFAPIKVCFKFLMFLMDTES